MDPKDNEVRKHPYSRPVLSTYGSIEQLTRTVGAAGGPDRVGMNTYTH